jgi:hypothetical protein
MASTTYSLAKAIALTDYMPAFRASQDLQLWDWQKIFTTKSTSRATEQVFSYAGLPSARRTGELEPVYYADIAENAATTFTVYKYSLASMFSREALEDNQHLPELMREAGTCAGEGQSYVHAESLASVFNDAFTAAKGSYDALALCSTHTMKDGTSYDNALTAASLTFDNLWTAINHFETTLVSHSGLYLKDKVSTLLYHPSKEKEVRALLNTTEGQPGTADNDYNSLRDYKITPVSCRFLSSSTAWFLLGSKAKKDFIYLKRAGVKTEMEDDFDREATKIKSTQRYAFGFKDFIYLCGNPGA